MSYNHNLYHRKFRGKSTFQNTASVFVPPPPPPPSFFIPPVRWGLETTDEDIIKQFEHRIRNVQPVKSQPSVSISKVRDEIRNLTLALNEIKMKQKMLSEKMNDLSDDEWSTNMKQIEENKAAISEVLANINSLNTDVLRKCLAKRSAKRARQKRQRIEKKKEKEEMKKENKEKSLKIDEYLQKFQDDINKIKQEEEAKLQADAVLRETIRKKQDTKKCIVKLEALVKLRRARQNTAKGRGENVSEKDAEVFEKNIEKLKTMWSQRLAVYNKEEAELRSKLKEDSKEMDTSTNETERDVTDNLTKWKQVLFGGVMPQVDFAGDVHRFVEVRSQWDEYLSSEGSSIPVGWVPPAVETPVTTQ